MSLHAERLGLERGGRLLLDAVDLQINPGRVHGLLGPNGAGKSSLLAVLAGELPPQRGSVSLDGQALPPPAALARRRAVLSQQEEPAYALRASELIALARLPHAPEAAARTAHCVDAALAAVDAAALGARRYANMSDGERSRLRLARALAQVWEQFETGDGLARYLLLDEPAAHLDPAHQHAALKLARRFADMGGAVLVTLHDPALAAAYADDVTLLRGGQVLAQGQAGRTLTDASLSALYGLPLRLQRMADGGYAVWNPPVTGGHVGALV